MRRSRVVRVVGVQSAVVFARACREGTRGVAAGVVRVIGVQSALVSARACRADASGVAAATAVVFVYGGAGRNCTTCRLVTFWGGGLGVMLDVGVFQVDYLGWASRCPHVGNRLLSLSLSLSLS